MSGACAAPFASLYLDQRGLVRACCMNDTFVLGDLTRSTLLEVWQGDRAARLRTALTEGSFELGCDVCAGPVESGMPELAYARTFDRFADLPGPRWPRQLELSLSNACNLQCVMCNGEWSSSIRAHRDGLAPLPKVYRDDFFDELSSFVPHLERVNFLGGEPFLSPEALRVMELLADSPVRPTVHVTTNGTQWSPRVARLVEVLAMDVTISIDAVSAATYESIRVGARWGDVRANVVRFQKAAGRTGGSVGVVFCLMAVNWQELYDFCAWADRSSLRAGVNTVRSPAHLSLVYQPLELLEEVVERLHAQDRSVGDRLGASRDVWRSELRRITDELEGRRRSEVSTPVELRSRAHAELRLVTTAAAAEDALSARGAVRFRFDDSGRISEVPAGARVAGVRAEDLLAAQLDDVPRIVTDRLGSVTSSEAVVVIDGGHLMRTSYADGTSILGLLVTEGSGPTSRPAQLLLLVDDSAG